MPGHNAVCVFFGCLVALVGWMAWNVAGAILWLHAPNSALAGTALNTLLSASMALIAAFTVTRIRFGKPDASICANGWLAGLVASSAGSGIISPAAALVVGLVAGLATPLLVELLELALSIDDPSGAVAVHAGGGLWGVVAVGIFEPQAGQLLAQLVGIAAVLGLALPLIYLLFRLLDLVLPFGANEEGERLGMDLHELGSSAYPEFVIHRNESQR
jgi:Amt family ammonium transporter